MVVLFTLLKYCILLPNGGLLENANVATKYIIYNKFPYIGFLSKKSRLSAIDKYVHQCGFINHIDRIKEHVNREINLFICFFGVHSELF